MKEKKIFSKNSTFQKFEVLKRNRNKRYRYREFFVEVMRRKGGEGNAFFLGMV